jgi:hypothetical protein
MKIFGVGTLYGVPLTDAAGNVIANPTPYQFGVLQEVQADLSFDEKTLYGAYQFPVAFGRGKGKFTFKAKAAELDISGVAALFLGTTPTAAIAAVVDNFAASVPAVSMYTITITPPSAGTFVRDLGVRYASTGIELRRVASAPTAGQYSVAGAVYTFAAADASAAVLISYEYSATSTTQFRADLTNQLMGYSPSFIAEISVPYAGKQLVIKLNNCQSSKLALPLKNEDFSIFDFDFQAIADASNNLGFLSIR